MPLHRANNLFISGLIIFCALFVATTQVAVAGQNITTEPDFDAIDRYVAAKVRASHVPGFALAIVQNGKVRHLRGFGVTVEGGQPVTPQTPFILGSTSKSFTALAVMQLVEAGRLELDAPVQRYLPWFQVADPTASTTITLRQLLHHTSGLSSESGNQPMTDGDGSDRALENGVRNLSSAALDRPVGASYEYSNANYNILGLIVQVVSGESYENYVEERIFRPLSMQHAFTSKLAGEGAGLAVGHFFFFGHPIAAPNFAYPRSFVPCGFLIASAEDMAHYLAAQTNGGSFAGQRVLSPEGIATLHHPAITMAEGRSGGYGMGWVSRTMNDVPILWHNGDTGHFHSEMVLVPQGNWGFVLLANGSHPRTAMYYQEMAAGVTSLLVGKAARDDAQIHRTVGIIYYGILGIAIVQLVVLALAIFRLRRWRRNPATNPLNLPRRRWRIAVVGLANIAVALGMLYAYYSFIAPLLEVVLTMPDLGLTVISSAVVVVGWAIRTVLALRNPSPSPEPVNP